MEDQFFLSDENVVLRQNYLEVGTYVIKKENKPLYSCNTNKIESLE